ncbi:MULTISPECIES: STAS domain-containing protein [Halomonas]|uniref:STAS domain-containing protein n=3 Tax=Halomonas TaxID=2745 RepID=A0AAU7KLH2_9GAMM|nr:MULTISPECIES: STAS domain-containing protein [Halomonas]MBR9769588.1 STAS domain-containing protein [Gammaproteobacteria bacterium]KJZ12032.1 anti-sigma factor antagonist [Halomonas sp. S2151]MAR71861.1 anti-sigma factor antagonist [Halomonas sp.]MBR9878928.1 STAS domain-containing protein [Gammaproteobacteria bacterium]MBS8269016.1 anti-sigma factor antagonist [Halomonas litopenaei]|tara:strand:+ start:1308 stop:1817 length:510 start_codon:yes stop_codon:yes gene_type:complete
MKVHEGRLKAAFEAGVFVLKLCGDVRLTLCATLDLQAQQLADTPGLKAVMIDLREASNVDSTALGFLAKVAMALRGKLEQAPTIVADNPDVKRMLEVMGFGAFFTLLERPIAEVDDFEELPEVPADEEGLRERILEAHRILMRMNEHNHEQFQPLVEMLEAQNDASHKA